MKPARAFQIGAIDTETIGLDGELALAQVYHEYWKEAEVYDTTYEVIDRIFSLEVETLRETIWFAHNAEYDWRYMIKEMQASGYNLIFKERSPGKFFEIEVRHRGVKGLKGRVTRFRDSLAVFPFTLLEFTKQFAPEHIKDDIGLGAGGVLFDKTNPVHIAYAKNDVIGLVKALTEFDKLIYENYNIHLFATASGTAYEAWKRTLKDGDKFWRQCMKTEAFLRTGYYGGLVGCNADFGREYERVETLDINSSYPANMRLGVPMGRAVRTSIIRDGYPGFYKVKVIVPDDAIMPIVPYRSEKGNLAWMTGGPFLTTCTSLEIEYCQTLGVEFIEDDDTYGYYFPEGLCYPFNDFVDICERLRTEHKGKPLEIVVKLMQNSLYGRFGMKLEGREIVMDLDGQPDDMEAVYNPDNNDTIPNVYYKDTIRSTPYMLPHWAAWVTANARILIDTATGLAGRENVLYRDTDSMIGPIDIARLAPIIGKEYGKLKVESPKRLFRVHGPKVYTYTDEKGRTQAVAKGIPRSLLKYPVQGKVETDEQFAKRVEARNNLVAALHNDACDGVEFHSSMSLSAMMKHGKLYVDRKRSPTNPKNVYGHTLVLGKFRPRRA